jgi:hypothetical protein
VLGEAIEERAEGGAGDAPAMHEQQRLGIPGAAIDQMNAAPCRHEPDPICRSRHTRL